MAKSPTTLLCECVVAYAALMLLFEIFKEFSDNVLTADWIIENLFQ